MPVHKARKLRDGLFIAGAIVMLLGCSWEPILYLGVIVTFSCLIPHFLWNRCPHCRKQLGRNDGDYCQFCGRNLHEDE